MEPRAYTMAKILGWGADLRRLARESACLDEAASRVSQYLRERVVRADGAPLFGAVRTFKTHPVSELPIERRCALGGAATTDAPLRCLIELGALEPAFVELVPSNGAAPSLPELLAHWQIESQVDPASGFAIFDVPALERTRLPRHLFAEDGGSAIGFAGQLGDGERIITLALLREPLPPDLEELFETVALNAFHALGATPFESVFAA